MGTIRNNLTRKRQWLYIAALVAVAVFAGGMKTGMKIEAFLIIGLLGFIALMGCVAALLFMVRCPVCGGNLGYALSWPATWNLSVSEQIKFCQFCGVSLDKEIELKNSK